MENKNYAKFINFMAEMIDKYGEEVLTEIQEENNDVEVQQTANCAVFFICQVYCNH